MSSEPAAQRGGAASAEDSHQRQMLIGDENIVEAECAVFWRIKDARQFLFQIRDPQAAVKVEAESSTRTLGFLPPTEITYDDARELRINGGRYVDIACGAR